MTWTPTSSPTRRAAACASVGRGLDRRDVTPDNRRHEPGIDLLPADKRHIGRLDHRVGGLNHPHEAAGFDESERFARQLFRPCRGP